MIGVGWLVLMDDWLGRGGPLGAMLAFGIGGLLLLPIGYVYGHGFSACPMLPVRLLTPLKFFRRL